MSYAEIPACDVPARHPVAIFRDAWAVLSEGQPIANWRAFDPVDFPNILPWVLLLRQESKDDPNQLRYTICGDRCRETFGFSYQNKLFGEGLPADAVAERQKEFDRVRAGDGPIYSRTTLPIKTREFIVVFRGVFAFRGDTNLIDRIMVIIAPENIALTQRTSAKAVSSLLSSSSKGQAIC